MSYQQLLLIILSIVIIAIAVAVGFHIYKIWSISSNRDAILNDLNTIAVYANEHFMKSGVGRGGSYSGFTLPPNLQSNINGDYTITISADGRIMTLFATSRHGYGTVSATVSDAGGLTNIVFNGAFQP